jgi:hypothetical protein
LLAEKYNIVPGKSLRYTCYSTDAKGEPKAQKKKGRYCTFYAKDWLAAFEFEELFEKKGKPKNEKE